MKKLIINLLLITIFSINYPMGHTNISKNITMPIICFTNNKVVYIGQSTTRKCLEKKFGKEFPLNTAFFLISFKNLDHNIPEYILPEYIPYSYIKNKKEGDYLDLELYMKRFTFLCCQHASASYNYSTFEGIIATNYKKFLSIPDYLSDGANSLFHAHIIKRENNILDMQEKHSD